MSSITYAHTGLTARDWKSLADFYITVFDCTPVFPERDLHEQWVAQGTGVPNAKIRGIHLRLPGGDSGPTLEIFTYQNHLDGPEKPAANRLGLSHLAFHVDDVVATVDRLLQHGGSLLGEIVQQEFNGRVLTFVYGADLEGNIVEIQNWN